MAGALQDSRRAVLLGTKTFGESAIETLIPLNGQGAIRLTTSRYLTPSGRTIHGKGLEPDLDRLAAQARKAGAGRSPSRGRSARRAEEHGQGTGAPSATPAKEPENTGDKTSAKAPPKDQQAVVATGDIGTQSDEQLIEAIDVLRGLALVSGRTASR